MPKTKHKPLWKSPLKRVLKPSGGLETVKTTAPLSPYRHWDADDVDSLNTLWAAGVSIKHMAGTLGRTEASIRWKLANINLSKEKPTKHPYEDNADPFVIWLCDELEEQKIGQARVLMAMNKSYDRWYDLRMRGFPPLVPEIMALMKLVGYKLEIVPIEGSAHNGPDSNDT